MGSGVVTQVEAADHRTKVVDVAHRGASGYAPEHTITSYKMGERLHGDYIEIDLQMTKDGKLIAMHDETVDRTTDGTGRVKDLTLEQIKQLDAGSWFNEKYPQYANEDYAGLKVPTLEEIFKRFGNHRNYYIETKAPDIYPGMEEELLRLVDKYRINKRTLLIQSFSKESLLRVKELDASIKLVQLLSYKEAAVATDAEIAAWKEYAVGIGPNFTYLDQNYVQKVVKSGLQLHPYTVNETADMKRLIDWGVTGMFTNFPDRLHQLLKEQRK
ncbi:glycerophosphodiester phosphodiesterase [Fictibacillus sp. CENA-BCM004]|uniref:Glycerophosphodiester phosphodiesterase n=2 Tax=Fictibacillus terranigra TaxID=3058424 RepID=A0ABT8E1X2_9BACL|nr:glycerophosphodiester phosphodiesterase [Fictibacillus sp. CENA-BCM004]MDN4071909.1 glycerophosphodiester phosphodiesterase [Fictibacillus sp. CENA-BCM004]